MKKTFTLLFLFTIFCASVFAQTAQNNQNQTEEWTRLQSDNGEFSFEMPADFTYFYDKDGFSLSNSSSGFTGGSDYQFNEMQMFNAASGKTVMTVEIYRVSSPKSYLDELLKSQNSRGSKNNEVQSGFTIKSVEQSEVKDYVNKKDVTISYVTKLIASKKYLYVLTVANRGEKTTEFQRFLSSVKLNSTSTNQADSVKVVSISSLTPITLGQMGEAADASNDDTASMKTPNQPPKKNETPILFLTKPRASYTEDARRSKITGTIRLRLTFAKEGRVSKIKVVSTLSGGLMRNAVFSALRIRFIPKEMDNELVDTTNVVEYNYEIF